MNHLLTVLLPPRVLPKLDFKEDIPEEFASIVVIPSMLVRTRSAEVLLERLEIHFLANPSSRLRFALLTDFADAPEEVMPEDEALVRDALARVRALNDRYRGDGPELFFLFHRRRLWNPSQGCWMGWERKRGKLSEFNRLIRGDRETSYSVCSSDPANLPRTRFVITLDTDTQMPRDTVGRLVGTLAHPLNQPRFDPGRRRVVEGYGVLQPRVSFHLTAATHSHFASLLAASGGIDPYSTAASDAYMDLFGLGSFTGKGIYDVDAFEAATGETFPENRILSHDLIEGNYARCGLLSDTELFDDFPARYHAYARREHRWVRGDWQLLPWLGTRVPAPAGEIPNPLPALERWKLFDNLRRSLVPPSLVLLLVLGWAVLPGSPWLWTAMALAVLALPLLKWLLGAIVAQCALGLLGGDQVVAREHSRHGRPGSPGDRVPGRPGMAHVRRCGTHLDPAAGHSPQAAGMGDGGLDRTTPGDGPGRFRVRHVVVAGSGRRDRRSGRDRSAGSALGGRAHPGRLARGAARGVLGQQAQAARPCCNSARTNAASCGGSPGEPGGSSKRSLAIATTGFLQTTFRRFPTAASPTAHHRPTRGCLLLSTLAAHDLGYIGLGSLVRRLEKTFDSLERMEKHWGHFFNWYDTRTLKPLPPAYLSTVDSGNFLGCLVALKQGLKEKTTRARAGSAGGRRTGRYVRT